jgi:hypothetical protein
MLASDLAAQSRGGALTVGAASLRCGAVPAWLVADDAAQCWAAANPSDGATAWSMTTPAASVTCEAFGFGRVAVYGGARPTVDVLAAGESIAAPLYVRSDAQPRVIWNGSEVSVAGAAEQPGGVYCILAPEPSAHGE